MRCDRVKEGCVLAPTLFSVAVLQEEKDCDQILKLPAFCLSRTFSLLLIVPLKPTQR